MKIREIINSIEGEFACGESHADAQIDRACASDLMSDILTLNSEEMILITGLINMQVIRTAEMADIKHILFVRNKKPSQEMIDLANREDMSIILSKKSMFATCGLLAKAGLEAVY